MSEQPHNVDNNSSQDKERILAAAHGSMLQSAKVLYLLFSVVGVVILIAIIIIQLGADSELLRERGERHSYLPQHVQATRGNILSDDGRILSTSIPYYELRMDFAAPGLTDTLFEATIGSLSSALADFFEDKDSTTYDENLREARKAGKRYYRLSPRDVNYIELQKIKTFPLINEGVRRSGFIAEKTFTRVSPFGDVAKRTMGFVNSTGVKVGLEGSFDDVLRGVEGLVVKQKISGNFWIPVQSRLNIDPVDGLDVRTTINVEIQDVAQSALRDRIKEVEADWGTVIVMEVATGNIKAIANITRKKDGTLVEDYNYAIGHSGEPGSTFKLPVLISLLENSNLTLENQIDCEDGSVKIGKAIVKDTRSGGYGMQTLRGVFAHSSNIGMAKAANRIYKDRPADFVDDLLSMGLGKELGLQIQGEPRPTFKHPDVKGSGWDGTSLTMMSFGYALRMTPLQTLSYYNAVANGGKLIRPRLVTDLMRGGEVVKEYPMEVINEQIASKKTLAEAKDALCAVVNDGTAKFLKNPLYSVAAKTGTAQIAMGRSGYRAADGTMQYQGSIAGFFPAEKPKYSIMIAFKTTYKPGSGKVYYGGSLSAPLFKVIADGIYNSSDNFIERYNPNGNELKNAKGKLPAGFGRINAEGVPSVIGAKFNKALTYLEGKGYAVRSSGFGIVVKQEMVTDKITGEKYINLILN